jgi:hypothetical protein
MERLTSKKHKRNGKMLVKEIQIIQLLNQMRMNRRQFMHLLNQLRKMRRKIIQLLNQRRKKRRKGEYFCENKNYNI